MLTRISRIPAAAVVLGCIAALASACVAGPSLSPAESTPTRVPPSPASAAASSSPAAGALAAYVAMWREVAEASSTDDYQAAYLSDHLSGQALLTITDNLAVDKSQGIVGRGSPVLRPVATSASATAVAVSDCLDDRGWLQYYASTGKPVDEFPGGFRATTATVTDKNGIWTVTQINTGADGSCHI